MLNRRRWEGHTHTHTHRCCTERLKFNSYSNYLPLFRNTCCADHKNNCSISRMLCVTLFHWIRLGFSPTSYVGFYLLLVHNLFPNRVNLMAYSRRPDGKTFEVGMRRGGIHNNYACVPVYILDYVGSRVGVKVRFFSQLSWWCYKDYSFKRAFECVFR